MPTTHYLACDLGAESGRLMLGTLSGGKLTLDEIHRFPNTPVRINGSLHWDVPRLFAELKAGFRKACAENLPVSGYSTDSWGVDYLLFAEDGGLISPSYHYRDERTQRGVAQVFKRLDWETIFDETGIQYMPINTIFQLAAESRARLEKARWLCGVGDGFNFMLSGVARVEESMASTFQLYNPRRRTWSDSLIDALGLPRRIFPAIAPSGTVLGPLRSSIVKETGLPEMPVIASCSHDTATAVAAVPAEGSRWAYLSSGTWSLMGLELPEPVITAACRELNFTNEIGFGGSVRLLKNIIGLWLVQECRRDWARRGMELDYATITDMADRSPPFVALIDPADPRFLGPDDMPAKVLGFCRETGQSLPEHPGAIVRCILESLALLYRRTLEQLEQLAGWKIEQLHIVGGGSRNAVLNQFTANALDIPVICGPSEATIAGNVLIQAITLGHLPGLHAAREVVRRSTAPVVVMPRQAGGWREAYQRFCQMAPVRERPVVPSRSSRRQAS